MIHWTMLAHLRALFAFVVGIYCAHYALMWGARPPATTHRLFRYEARLDALRRALADVGHTLESAGAGWVVRANGGAAARRFARLEDVEAWSESLGSIP